VVVDPGEAEVLERFLAQNLKDEVLRRLRRKAPLLHLVEQGLELGTIHCGKCLTAVDLATSGTVT
jgi:hypothetical protein